MKEKFITRTIEESRVECLVANIEEKKREKKAMTKELIKFTNSVGSYYMIALDGKGYQLAQLVTNAAKRFQNDAPVYSIYQQNDMLFEELPVEIIREVMETLKVYEECHVEFFGDEFHVCVGWILTAIDPDDLFICGTYRAKEIYTKEQRRQNFIESFGYPPFGNY